MEEKGISKLRHLDLSKRGSDLDRIFDFVINKIPDLCMPASFRLASEDDYLNKTKDIKLIPFKKQRIFDSEIFPELNLKINPKTSVSYPVTPSPRSTPEPNMMSLRPRIYHNTKDEPTLVADQRKRAKVSFKRSTQLDTNPRDGHRKNKKFVDQSNRRQAVSAQTRMRFEFQTNLRRHYSRLRPNKRSRDAIIEELHKSCYDRLYRSVSRKLGTGTDVYPYANPIPDCMLTSDNIDNLHEIIVSSTSIEWKMLTPVRPNSDYEDRFFDKLINLHRLRYKARLDSSYHNNRQSIPFVHTRHASYISLMASVNAKRNLPTVKCREQEEYPSLAVGIKLKRRFRSRASSSSRRSSGRSDSIKHVNIPTLMLTSDEMIASSPIENEPEERPYELDFRASSSGTKRSIAAEDSKSLFKSFSYEKFSRYSSHNMKTPRNQRHRLYQETKNSDQDEGEFDEGLDNIMNQLIGTDFS